MEVWNPVATYDGSESRRQIWEGFRELAKGLIATVTSCEGRMNRPCYRVGP